MATLHEASESRPERTGFWLFAGHVVTLFSLAASNILLGATLLSLPWTRRRPVPWRDLAPMLVPLGLYVVLLGGSIIASYEPWVSLRSLTELFTLSTLAVAPLLLRRERQVRWAVDALVVVSALVALQGLSQYLIGYGDIDRRIRGPFSHYMTFSGVLLICDLLLITTMVYAGRWRSPWRWVALAVINVAIVGSYTRGAWVALGLTLTALALLRAPRLLLAWMPVAVVFAVLAPVPLLHRVTSIADVRDLSNYDRLCMLEAGLTMIRERPLFGQGPDLVKRRYAIYRPPTAPRYTVPHLHNNLLQLAAERGLPALGAYLGLTAAAMTLAWRQFRREGGRRGPRADLLAGSLLAILAFNLAGLFENSWGDTEVQRAALFVLAIPFCLRVAERGDIQASTGTAVAPPAGETATSRGTMPS